MSTEEMAISFSECDPLTTAPAASIQLVPSRAARASAAWGGAIRAASRQARQEALLVALFRPLACQQVAGHQLGPSWGNAPKGASGSVGTGLAREAQAYPSQGLGLSAYGPLHACEFGG